MKDLFGEVPEPVDDKAPVTIALTLNDQSDAAWLLSDVGGRLRPKWAPKSQIKRGEGRDENLWTMPRWLARDRGWM
ncbi:hypothetical protein [Brevundimonas sp. TWP2-3-4b1]|uniref:hypothetical protein n=1 Tax=Brevundimonas sp. TWP2-3-4b1 TaxID=2804580 RepID=UPI003CF95D52